MFEPRINVALGNGSLLTSLPARFSYEREEDGTIWAFLVDAPNALAVRLSVITVTARAPAETAEIDLAAEALARGRDANRQTQSFGDKAWFCENQESHQDGRPIWLRFWHVGYRNHQIIVSFCCDPQEKEGDHAIATLNLIPGIIADLKIREGISPLTDEENESLEEQRDVVSELLRTRYDCFSVPKVEGDLPLLQQLVDDRVFSPEQEYEWSCVGAVLGDVIATELGLEWIAHCDEYGAEPALNLANTSITVFPRSMILKRVEQGEWPELNFLLTELRAGIEDLKQRGC